MLTDLQGIVLRIIPYSDQRSLAIVYTDLWGTTSFILPSGPEARKGKKWVKLVQPLRLLQITTPSAPTLEVKSIRQVTLLAGGAFPSPRIPESSGLSMYLAQLTYQLLRQESADEALFSLLQHAIRQLDEVTQLDEIALFDLSLLISILRLKGYIPISIPIISYRSPTMWLDLREMILTPFSSPYSIPLSSNMVDALPHFLTLALCILPTTDIDLTPLIPEARRLFLRYAQNYIPAFGTLTTLLTLIKLIE